MDLAGAGAVMTGVAALASALLSARVTRKRADTDCDRRVAEINKAFRAGMRLQKKADSGTPEPRKGSEGGKGEPWEDRWSHLP